MKKTLARDTDRTEIMRRIAQLTPVSPRQWGVMPIGGMICHLDDSYRVGLGEVTAKPIALGLPGSVLKFAALRLPIQWSKNLKTTEEVRQGGGGTVPGSFAEDRARLIKTLERFCMERALDRVRHPLFGNVTQEEWLRWGFLHADHHLRQFGV